MTGAGSCCINICPPSQRQWISWDCACLVTAYITALKVHVTGLCSSFYIMLYNMLASKTSTGDASTNSSLSKNNDSCV